MSRLPIFAALTICLFCSFSCNSRCDPLRQEIIGCRRDVQNAAFAFEIYLHDHPSSRSATEILEQLQAQDRRGEFDDVKAWPDQPLLRCGPDSAPIQFNADLSKWHEIRQQSRYENDIAAYVRCKMTNGQTIIITYNFNSGVHQLSPTEASQIDPGKFVDMDSIAASTQPTPSTVR